jgi:type VI secretion system protein ImpK
MDVLARLVLAQAARLARRGAYGAAEALLGESVVATSGPRADVLDLKARIRAQQGRWAEAEALWREVLALDPGHAQARVALARLGGPARGWHHLAVVAARSLVAVAVLLLVWTVAAQRREIRRLATVPPAAVPPATAAPAEVPAASTPDVALLDSLEALLAPLAGVEVVRLDRELEVRFREGLFSEGLAFRPGARDVVAGLARTLGSLGVRTRARIVGHTDSLPLRAGAAYSSNTELGFARAMRVASMLLEAGVLDAGYTAVQSAADASPPADALASGAPPTAAGVPLAAPGDRTVTLYLAPAG